MLLGIFWGLAAGALWGFSFLVPKILTGYTAADIALGRYVVFGLISAALLVSRFKRVRSFMTWGLAAQALGLSCLSFSCYYMAMAASVKYSGIVPAALVIGLLPVTIPLITRDQIVNRRHFYLSLAIIFTGLLLLNLPLLKEVPVNALSGADSMIGFSLAIVALVCWTVFAPLNTRVLTNSPDIDSATWSSLLGFLAMITMLPLWLLFGLKEKGFTSLSAHYLALPYICWCVFLGVAVSWVATYFWNCACRRIPTALAGQMLVSETLFALLYNYIYEWRLPATFEIGAATLLIVGSVLGIHAFRKGNTS